MAVSTTVAILSIAGLGVGLGVLLVVISLLHNTLKPLLTIKADIENALTAPMLKTGIPGTDQLATTRRLADSVPDLAGLYLAKLGMAADTAVPALTYAPSLAPAPEPTPAAPAPAPAPVGAGASWSPPDYHRWRG